MKFVLSLAVASMALSAPVVGYAQEEETEEVIVTSDMEFPADATWMHSFDAYESETGKPNGAFRRALGMIRAMEAEGVNPDRIKVAIVVHGPAVFDVVNDARYSEKYEGESNQNYNDIAQLIAYGAEIWVCGVAAKYHGVGNAHLLEGVKMAPSGTVAHAELQRRGYGLNAY